MSRGIIANAASDNITDIMSSSGSVPCLDFCQAPAVIPANNEHEQNKESLI